MLFAHGGDHLLPLRPAVQCLLRRLTFPSPVDTVGRRPLLGCLWLALAGFVLTEEEECWQYRLQALLGQVIF